jgi:RAD51-like protein 2
MARPLSSLALPRSTLSTLTRAGYETLQDISTVSPETLAQGLCFHVTITLENDGFSSSELNISLSASQAIVALSQKQGNDGSLTQSAASMLTSTSKVATGCVPVDRLLNGGLSRGHILEISGPPGSAKEQLAINFVRSFVEAGEEVLFVGMLLRKCLYSRHVAA